ncbi:HPP family protein [Vibrio sp. SS-MA-C1-2]|uniref:HPP family protein n=1 Tax=Vibrio sp. SS-MA-C1-2 TaxID=2908646 RepID=UPI001F3C4F5B|nr:HPP family protein [Vibrio sp. SS-MA-C1-2]UJF16816.1 HPP family protein [Vibrio sp. SS-MA-C1-2]
MKHIFHTIHPDNRVKVALIAALGSTICISILAGIDQLTNHAYLLAAPFGATMVLAFGVHQSPLAQPKNIIFGHLLTAFIGLLFVNYVEVNAISLGVAVGLGIFFMIILKITHPPAGGNPLLIMLTGHTSWSFLITPFLLGSVIIVLIAYVFHKYGSKYQYPFNSDK